MEKMQIPSSGDKSEEKREFSRVKLTPVAGAGPGDNGGEITPSSMEKMSIGNSSDYPDMSATWDPDGRLHSVLPYLNSFSRICICHDAELSSRSL